MILKYDINTGVVICYWLKCHSNCEIISADVTTFRSMLSLFVGLGHVINYLIISLPKVIA